MGLKPEWHLVHGPDRSHDALESVRFSRKRDAITAACALDASRHWRILRVSTGVPWMPAVVKEVSRGGPDEVKRIQRERFRQQYLAACRE